MQVDKASKVSRSTYRLAVLRQLSESDMIPTKIADETDIGIAHVSRTLNELREMDVVELLVEEDTKMGRVYGITEEGEETLEYVEGELNG